MGLKYIELNYKLCNETSMANKNDNYFIDVKLNELFCVDGDEFNLIEGSWSKNEVFYIEINLYNCKNGTEYNEQNPNCAPLSNLLNYYNTSWYFELYYPIVQFQLTDEKVLIYVGYKSHYYRLSSFNNKVDRLFLK